MFCEIPSEIWHVIFANLSFRDCIRCTRVCRNWRSTVLGWPGLWQEISSEHGYDSVSVLRPYTSNLQKSSVQRFHINTHADRQSAYDKVIRAMETIDFLIEHDCDNIQTASLIIDFWPMSLLYKTTAICQRSLTRLDLLFVHKLTMDTYVIPTVVLRQLPNLVTLIYRAVVTQTDESVENHPWRLFEPALIQPHQSLTQLTIDLFGNGRPLSVHMLIRLLPKLQRISLNALDCEYSHAVLRTLIDYCHDIELIEVHDGQDDNFRPDEATTTHGAGLQYLVVDGDDRFTEAHALEPVIHKYHNTLRFLRIKGYEPLNRMMLSQWASLSFSRLRDLVLVNTDDQLPGNLDLCEDLCTFLRHATLLQYVDLTVANLMTDEVLGCLAEKDLTELRISSCSTLSETGFIRFVQSPSIQKHLKHLALNDVDVLTGSILNVMPENLTSLERLSITSCKHVQVDRLSQFLDGFRRLLTRVDLVCFARTDQYTDALLDAIINHLRANAVEWKFALETSSDGTCPPSIHRMFTSDTLRH
ncbi:hypothetical protein BJV82DRAFT_596135 [Fennellomyces sp. T-0311]|nr:hypothetical protein BJV82DRAFT_596135 [Fennellomyces sp. T-0311]